VRIGDVELTLAGVSSMLSWNVTTTELSGVVLRTEVFRSEYQRIDAVMPLAAARQLYEELGAILEMAGPGGSL
jgi:hypothetical protein